MGPPSFSGGADPLATENWIQDVKDIMTVLPDVELFLELFFDWYFPTTVRIAKATKFLHLTQEQLTVQQKAARFIEFSRFASHLAPDEEKKVRKFEEGLRQNFFEQVIDFRAQTFAEVVDIAAVIESDMQRGTAAQSQRKRPHLRVSRRVPARAHGEEPVWRRLGIDDEARRFSKRVDFSYLS
ncbi:uncharacterized protein LOC131160981 [Malania oleifera]|uniref:uncharacterized protein LOC131160981 n=1 Tax=Malania oleifera TaxID=397392 RepID=UPI0025AE3FB0|nr:uncharacterized protein LOC131160981 [Malania oleifera]